MKSVIYALILALLALPLCYADVGPSPDPPDVVVHLVSDGAPASGVSEITYHCMGTNVTEPSNAVEPYMMAWSCSGGTCTNEGAAYYKFNPCFNFPGGYFSYEFDGKEVRSEDFDVGGCSSSCVITIDAASGQVESVRVSEIPSLCPPGLLLPLLLGAALFLSRK